MAVKDEETSSEMYRDDKIRLEIAEKIYREVMGANLHQSEIAARLLAPIAFLTAAAMSLFGSFMRDGITFLWGGVDLVIMFFLVYIFCTLCGTILIIEVIGPSFEIKGGWPLRKKEQKSSIENPGNKDDKEEKLKGLRSIVFFKFILDNEREGWRDTIAKEEPEILQKKLLYDYLNESYQLAKKTQGKVKRNLVAHLFFYPSFCSLLLMAFTGIFTYAKAQPWIILYFTGATLLIFGFFEIKKLLKLYDELKIGRRT